MLAGVGQMGLFLGVKHLVQSLQTLGDVGGVSPVGQVLGFDEQKDLSCAVGDQYIGQLAAQALVAQVGVGVERDIGAVQGQIFASRDFLDVAVEQGDALGVAGREFVEEVARKKLGAEVALFFGFDEGGVREDHRIFPGQATAQGMRTEDSNERKVTRPQACAACGLVHYLSSQARPRGRCL